MGIDLLAEIGDGQLVGVLSQQLDAEVGFELGELAADRRFRHAEQRRRLRQAAAFDDLAEHQQGIEVERRILFHELVPNMQQGVARVHLFSQFPRL